MTELDADAFEATLLAATSDAVLVLDEGGTVTYQGPTVASELGYEEDELLGTNSLDHVHPEDRGVVAEAFGALGTGEEAARRVDCRITTAGAGWRWVELALTRPVNESAEGYVVSARDISERIAAQRDRDDLLDRMTDAFFAVDEEWRFTYVNSHAEDLLGIDEDAAVGTTLWNLLPELVGTTFEERYREALDSQEAISFKSYYEPLERWFEASAYPSELGLSVFFEDVTERVRTEQALASNEKALHELHDVAADKGLAFEQKLVRLLELGRERLDLRLGFLTRIDDDVQRVVACQGEHDELVEGESCPLDDAYCQKTIQDEELLATRDPTGEWVPERAYEAFGLETYVGGKVIVDGELYGTLCFADTRPRETEFRSDELAFVEVLVEWMAYELERDLREDRLEEQNDRLETFASMVSHDLRNPLTVAQGHLASAREAGDDAEIETALSEVERSHTRMQRLIEDMLWLAREGKSVGSTQTVPLADAAREAWSFVSTDDAQLSIDTEDATLETDRDRLLQLFENLFRNAIEHAAASGGGTSVADGVDAEGAATDVTVRVDGLQDGFVVEDDGPGIPEDERETVFDAGYTTARDGTGYGLAIVEQIATAHGWTIQLGESAEGGARFAFRSD